MRTWQATWAGEQIPADSDIPLIEGWNIIAYLPTYELDASAPDYYVLSPIIDHVIIAKDADGTFMYPEWEYSNMPPWRETQGYQVKVDEDIVLNYPEEPEDEGLAMVPAKEYPADQHWADVIRTGDNMSVLILEIQNSKLKTQNSQIAAFNSDGLLVGVGWAGGDARKVAGGDAYATGLAVWGDDESTEEKEGLAEGEAFELRYWNASEDKEMELEVKAFHTGKGLTYETNSFLVIDVSRKADIPQDYYLSQNYPNPFNSSTRIRYGLPEAGHVSLKVYDISGRVVNRLIDRQVTAGHHVIEWDARQASSGLYLLQLEASHYKAIRKVVLAK